jgi:Uma2 family endonuclease
MNKTVACLVGVRDERRDLPIYTGRMGERAVPHEPLSVEEYLKLEEASQKRHEYVAGNVYAHAGGTRRHDIISGNLFALLWNASRGGRCRVHTAGRLLRISDDVFYYPDVMVVCPPEDEAEDNEALFEESPSIIVEVTSPTTEATDRREKMLAYRRIPSPRTYLIVAQESLRVERHWRDEAVGPEGVVPVPCPEIELTLAQIYEGL